MGRWIFLFLVIAVIESFSALGGSPRLAMIAFTLAVLVTLHQYFRPIRQQNKRI
jgi:hypothetical protein